ncbi:DUF3786 domain-containing protein [Candidatus Magnetomoraceae bacterium gMMP-15]
MTDNYAKIVCNNLEKFYKNLPKDISNYLPGEQSGKALFFKAFGENCRIRPNSITLGDEQQTGVIGILISLYALHAKPDPLIMEPLKAFKDFPNSMPYVGAFATHTENILVPHVDRIEKGQDKIFEKLKGNKALSEVGGDFSFVVHPLPKIALCYIFYKADEEFTASTTCLFSSNALLFEPIDGLADVGEYTSKKILEILD